MPTSEPVERFTLALEQLQLCRELLLDGSPAKARMAVILLDGLADAILYRRLERLYRVSENEFVGLGPYGKDVRRQARNDFGKRVSLCSDPTADTFVSGGGGPLVTTDAAVVLRVGHSYRNAAYHRDRHNPATIGAVGRVFFKAVAELFERSQFAGHTSGGLPVEQIESLRRLGVPVHGSSINWREAASTLAQELSAALAVPHAELVTQLADDLVGRAAAVEELAAYVPGTRDEFDSSMASLEFRDAHGADEQLLDFGERRDPVRRSVVGNIPLTQELRDEGAVAERLYQERLVELRRTWQPRATMRSSTEATDIAKQLREETETLHALTVYQGIDGKLDILEDYSTHAVIEFDHYVDMQIEAARER